MLWRSIKWDKLYISHTIFSLLFSPASLSWLCMCCMLPRLQTGHASRRASVLQERWPEAPARARASWATAPGRHRSTSGAKITPSSSFGAKWRFFFIFFLSLHKKLISSRKKPQTTCFGENEWEELSLESVMFFFLTGPIYHRSLRQPASNILEACVPSPAQEICDTQLKGKENICEHSSFPCWQWGGVSPSSFRPGGSQPLFFLLLP